MTREDVRRWVSNFEAAERAGLEDAGRRGPRPAWSIGVALSMIRAVRAAAGGGFPPDPARADAEEAVRRIWGRLRAAHGPMTGPGDEFLGPRGLARVQRAAGGGGPMRDCSWPNQGSGLVRNFTLCDRGDPQ